MNGTKTILTNLQFNLQRRPIPFFLESYLLPCIRHYGGPQVQFISILRPPPPSLQKKKLYYLFFSHLNPPLPLPPPLHLPLSPPPLPLPPPPKTKIAVFFCTQEYLLLVQPPPPSKRKRWGCG